MTNHTITRDWCRRLACAIEDTPFVTEFEFSGCARYEDGVRCGRPVVETLVPIYGDHGPGDEFSVPVCSYHLAEHEHEHHPLVWW